MPYQNPYGMYQTPYYQGVPDMRQTQYQPQMMNPQQVNTQQANNGIIWVQGEESAKAYMVAPGNSVLLMDSENNAFYIKSSDASGMPMPLRVFDYVERTATKTPGQATHLPNEEYVTRQEFDALAARFESILNTDKENTENV